MAILITLKGPSTGRRYTLEEGVTDLGRHANSVICLESQAVSRHHARIVLENGEFFIEDLNSSNGTFLNGKRIDGRLPLTERDTLQIGPYAFALRQAPTPTPTEGDLVIRSQVSADRSDHSIYGVDASRKLQAILEITQHLGRTLDPEELLNTLLEHLMRLFPQADRSMVLLNEQERLVVRAQQCRRAEDASTYPYSRTIVQRALADGIGILSDDIRSDERFQASSTISSLDMRSLMCVPLIGQEGKRLGILQIDRFRQGKAFSTEDLQLLTAVGLQMAVVLENAGLHAELMRQERLRQELALAREIQQGFLPSEFPAPHKVGYELFARVIPAREVAGDLYDFFPLADGRLVFFVGDVSGKGMPAALFMIAVRILGRHLASLGDSPSETMRKLNTALASDNPSAMFVTLMHGVYTPSTGEIVLASGGHPMPLVRRIDGKVEMFSFKSGRLLGYEGGNLGLVDATLTLATGETLILYTDGFPEARSPDGAVMLGPERLLDIFGGARTHMPLDACADEARAAIERFTGSSELQDDLTLLLLRRVPDKTTQQIKRLPTEGDGEG